MDLNWLRGRTLTELSRYEHSWAFIFGKGCSLTVECPWRIVAAGRIAIADTDHDQQFGLPKPIDVPSATMKLLSGSPIKEASVQIETADLCLRFEDGKRLELTTDSSGYESWQLNSPDGTVFVGRNA